MNHIGFLVPNTQESIAKWKAAGLKAEPGAPGRTDQGFVTTPEGVRIEILEDKAQAVPIRSHHIHFNVAESAIPEIQAWYAKTFGAKPGMRGQNQAADVPGENLTFSRSADPTVTTKGRALDHIGFEISVRENGEIVRAHVAGAIDLAVYIEHGEWRKASNIEPQHLARLHIPLSAHPDSLAHARDSRASRVPSEDIGQSVHPRNESGVKVLFLPGRSRSRARRGRRPC